MEVIAGGMSLLSFFKFKYCESKSMFDEGPKGSSIDDVTQFLIILDPLPPEAVTSFMDGS
jgi:hypothetical protein